MASHRSAGIGATLQLKEIKITGQARGDLIVRLASAWAKLVLGTSGKIPISDGTDLLYRILIAGDIPSLDAAKIITGAFALARIPTLPKTKIDTAGEFTKDEISSIGTWLAAEIPNLDTSKITTGVMATARLGSGATGSNFLRGDQTYASAGGTLSRQNDLLTSSETTTSTSYVSTALSITLANRSGGMALIVAHCPVENNTVGASIIIALFDDGVTLDGDSRVEVGRQNANNIAVAAKTVLLNGSVMNVRMRVASNTGLIAGSSGTAQSAMTVLEIS